MGIGGDKMFMALALLSIHREHLAMVFTCSSRSKNTSCSESGFSSFDSVCFNFQGYKGHEGLRGPLYLKAAIVVQ